MADYRLDAHSLSGNALIGKIEDWLWLDYTLAENNWTTLRAAVPPKYEELFFDADGLLPDIQLVVYRRNAGGEWQVEGDKSWLLRQGRLDGDPAAPLVLTAHSCVRLLDRRIVAYDAGTSEAAKGPAAADDMMKEIVDENLGASATDSARDISTFLDIQADRTLGVSTSKSFSRRNVLDVLQELAQDSANGGTYLAFDVIWFPPGGKAFFEFRTYTGQRGVDHTLDSSIPLNIGPEFGNLEEAYLEYDHDDERNFVYAGGQGEQAAREIETASDATAIARSLLNRIEYFRQATFVETGQTAQLQAEADAALRERRARLRFYGKLRDTQQTVYGQNYGWGDLLTVQLRGREIDAHLPVVSVYTDHDTESVNAYLSGEVALE